MGERGAGHSIDAILDGGLPLADTLERIDVAGSEGVECRADPRRTVRGFRCCDRTRLVDRRSDVRRERLACAQGGKQGRG